MREQLRNTGASVGKREQLMSELWAALSLGAAVPHQRRSGRGGGPLHF